MNKEKFYRVELTIAEHNVMFDIAKLYAGEVFSYINGISYTGTVIDVTGYQFLPNVEHDTYDIKMVFVNESGQIFELPKIEWEGVYDITSAYNDGVNYGNPWYRFTYDTAVLAPGKYILKTVLYVNDFQISSEVLNSYNQDFSEVVSSADNNISISTNQDVRFRLELNVVPK
jgi:hypothetical protein